MKRILSCFFLLIMVCLLFVSPAFADEGWVIERFDSTMTIQSDGYVDVTETISVDFFDLQKHGIYRDIPYVYQSETGEKTYTDIQIVGVTQDNNLARNEVTRNGAMTRIKIGEAKKTIFGKHTYVIHYKVGGVLRNIGDTDELYWDVTGNEWAVPIQHVTAKITLPSGSIVTSACYQGGYGSTEKCEVKQSLQAATFVADNLAAGEGVTVAASYPAGLLPIITVPEPPTFWEQIQWVPLFTTFFIIVGVGCGVLFRKWWREGRDAWFGHKANREGEPRPMPFGVRESIAPEFTVPENLRPAEMGVLIDERADTLDVSATIVDLASRGYLTITEVPKKWAWGAKDYILKRKKEDVSELLAYEKKLLLGLFAEGKEVTLSSLKNKFYDDLSKVKSALYDEVLAKKLFIRNPDKVRTMYYVIGFVLLFVGLPQFILGIVLADDIRITPWVWPLLGGGGGFVVMAIVSLVSAFAMPARTAHGRDLYRKSLGYKLFVSQVEKFRAQFLEKEGMFEAVLPYAIVFGVTKELARAMKVLEIETPQPSWYVGTHPFSPSVFANDVDTLSSTLSTAIASSPSSSGSGGSGFSGGGFGGGGGGSW